MCKYLCWKTHRKTIEITTLIKLKKNNFYEYNTVFCKGLLYTFKNEFEIPVGL